MRAGKLRHRIKITTPTESRGDTGEITYTWSTLATVWASVEPISGRELIQADQMQAEATVRIRLRYIPNLTTQCRIVHKGRTLEIVSAQNITDRNAEFELLCREAV